jgi:hypothetical protein
MQSARMPPSTKGSSKQRVHIPTCKRRFVASRPLLKSVICLHSNAEPPVRKTAAGAQEEGDAGEAGNEADLLEVDWPL